MRYWWVNQNQTFAAEFAGGYIWSPKRNQNGARNQFYENMREVSPGDQIFSFRRKQIVAIGAATSNCYEAPKPAEFGSAGSNWEQIGWRVDVGYHEIKTPITPKQHIEQIRPLLPEKYSPLQQSGDGLQSVYLAEITPELADLLKQLLNQSGNENFGLPKSAIRSAEEAIRDELEGQLELQVRESGLSETEKEQVVKSRRGQGRFRENVLKHEQSCRVTGVSDVRFLVASHIKPWRDSTNSERLDGENGFMLSPNVDWLFDRGFISFEDDGTLLISPVIDLTTLQQLGIPEAEGSVGEFSEGQKHYLAYHRRELFLQAGRTS